MKPNTPTQCSARHFPKADTWHYVLGQPKFNHWRSPFPSVRLHPHFKKTGGSLAVVDVEFLQKEIFKQLPRQQGKLVIALTATPRTYSEWRRYRMLLLGAPGVDTATGNSFVLSSYLRHPPTVVLDQDVQPSRSSSAEFLNDPCTTAFPRKPQTWRRQVTGFRVGCACPQFLREIRAAVGGNCRSFNVLPA